MTNDLMAVEIEVDGTLSTTSDGASKEIYVETLSTRQIRDRESEMERTHGIPSVWRLTGLSLTRMKGACGGTRTPGLRITNPMHYQLCYTGDKLPETLTLDE